MIKYEDRQSKLSRHYRKVEAMIHRDCSVDDILRECPELDKLDVLDIDQQIFAKEMIRREKYRRSYYRREL